MKGDIILVFTFCLVVCECLIGIVEETVKPLLDPDTFKNVSELISSKGYPVEEHAVQTSDGFILSMQRIPDGRRASCKQGKKKPILLVHGLLAAGDFWVLDFPRQSLGFILADRGYDVWIANTRGCGYSMKHVKYKPDQVEFWNFSFSEVATLDLSALIDKVLDTTGEEKLYCIGHSQGTTAPFALLSESPEYNSKIKLLIAVAPAATLQRIKGPLKYIVPFVNQVSDFLGDKGIIPNGKVKPIVKSIFCALAESLCADIYYAAFSSHGAHLNQSRLDVYSTHYPSSSSVKSLVHYLQIAKRKKFTKFDYGRSNMAIYGQEEPPEYNVSKIETPVALISAKSDRYANPENVRMLENSLNCLVDSCQVPDKHFDHNDLVLALNAPVQVFDKILSLLRRY